MRHAHPHKTSLLYAICFIGFVHTLHLAMPVYINSNFLSLFTSEKIIGLIYTISSIVTMCALASVVTFLRKVGNYRMIMSLIIGQMVALTGLILSNSLAFIIPFFLANIVFTNLMVLNIDIFLESNSDNRFTGGIRGLFLTSLNIAWILSPMLAGSLIASDDYWKVYAASIGLLLPLLFLIRRNFRKFKDPVYPTTSLKASIKRVWINKNFYNIFMANIVLHVFYSWMVIYTPIYLHLHMGFDWDTIGIIFTIMLLPFILLQYPLGKIADSTLGEKELLTVGFIIISISTTALAFIEGSNVWVWALLLFLTRVGASMAEIMIETYFFKQIHTKDSNILSLFRITRPTAYIISPLITAGTLYFLDYRYAFAVLGIFVLLGLRYSLVIKDTN